MGNVFKVLSTKKITPQPGYFADRLTIELCENIHLHYRNLRIEFSKGEFLEFADAIAEAARELKK